MQLPEGFRPLLAATLDKLEDAPFPLLASVKVDGFRCLIVDGEAVSRELKPIANKFVRAALAGLPHGLDGELVTTTNGKLDSFNTVQSKLNSEDGEPEFRYYVFDFFALERGFTERAEVARSICAMTEDEFHPGPVLRFLSHMPIVSTAELECYEEQAIKDGWEGICLRDLNGPYKFGRSTVKEGTLLKYKRWSDDEAEIVGFKEEMANHNEASKSAIGRTERSSSKAGKVPKGTLGALVVRWKSGEKNIQFRLSSGLTREQRAEMWANREALTGKKVTFSYLGVGSKGAPRHPKFLGIRYDI